MAADKGEHISLAMQFVASFCWAIGAALSNPDSLGCYLQLTAALAWCVANFASAVSMGWFCFNCKGMNQPAKKDGTTSNGTSMRRLLSLSGSESIKDNDVEKPNPAFKLENGV